MPNYVHWKAKSRFSQIHIFESREPFFFPREEKNSTVYIRHRWRAERTFYFVRPPHRSRRKIEQPPGAQCRRG